MTREQLSRKLVSHTGLLAVIIGFAFVSRIAAALYLGNQVVDLPGTFDQISYNKLALRVLDGYGFSFGETWWPVTAAGAPTAHWSFLYTFFLVGVYFLFGANPLAARLIQAAVVAVAQPMIAYLLGKETFNREVGLLSAGITAVYSYFVYYSANLVTEPFYITGVLMVLYVSIRIVKIIAADLEAERFFDRYKLALALGISLGATVLLRQLFLLFIPFLFLWIWLSVDRSKRRAVISHFFISSIIVGAMILPFTLYNYQRFNRFVLLNTNSGYAFFWGNHPIYGSHFIPILPEEMGSYQDLIPAELLHLDEAALDQALLREGLRFIVEDPVRIILLSFSRIPAYFMFWPSHDSGLVSNVARVSGFGLFLPLMLFGIVRSLSNRKHKLAISSPEVLLLLFALIYTGIHLLTWALIRYRLPVDAVLVIFAGLAFRDLILVYQRRAGRLPEISTKPLDGR